jgi:hypothetical protein
MYLSFTHLLYQLLYHERLNFRTECKKFQNMLENACQEDYFIVYLEVFKGNCLSGGIGRRTGLKILRGLNLMPVQVRP